MLLIHRDAEGELEIAVTGPVLADSEDEAREVLALLETCPVLDRAKLAVPYAPVRLEDLYAAVHESYPDDHRYGVDNMWTHAPIDDLLPGLRRIAETLPQAPSHMLWMNWCPSHPQTPRARTWRTASRTRPTSPSTRCGRTRRSTRRTSPGPPTGCARWSHLATGIQLADENLGRRPARFLTDAHYERYDAVRAALRPGRALPPVDGPPVTGGVRDGQLTAYLSRPLAPADPEALAAIEAGPMDPADALARATSTACSTRRRCASRPAGARCPTGSPTSRCARRCRG